MFLILIILLIIKKVHYIIVSSINVNNFALKCVHPDNIVQLKNKKIFKIDAILMKKKDTMDTCKFCRVYILYIGV